MPAEDVFHHGMQSSYYEVQGIIMQWKSKAPVSLFLRELAEEKQLNQESEATITKMMMERQMNDDSNKTQVSKSS